MSSLECVSISNQECNVRPEIVNVNTNESMFFTFSIKTSKCSGSCNNINDPYAKLCVPDVVKNLNVKVFNLMSRTNETRHEDFHSNLLKNDKKSHRDIDINYIGCITIKKLSGYENIHSVNQLCLINQSSAGHFKEKNGEKYLITKYEEVFFLELNQKLKQLMVENNCFMVKTMLELELIPTIICL